MATTDITTIIATIKNVSLFEGENSTNVAIFIDKTFKGFVLNNGVPEEKEVNYFYMSRRSLTYQLCNINKNIAKYRTYLAHGFSWKNLVTLLIEAKLKFNREFHSAGELLEGSSTPLERDCYITTIVDIELSPNVAKALNKVFNV